MKTIEIRDGKITNYEKLFEGVEWENQPGDCWFCCYAHRHIVAILKEENAIIAAHYKPPESKNKVFSKFYGIVGVGQFARCGKDEHNFHFAPGKENEETTYIMKECKLEKDQFEEEFHSPIKQSVGYARNPCKEASPEKMLEVLTRT